MENVVLQHFSNTIEAAMRITETLVEPLSQAAEIITEVLLNDGKWLVCGDKHSAFLAQKMQYNLLGCTDSDRPSLPIISLSSSSDTIENVFNFYNNGELFSRQIRALGNNQDGLLIFANSEDNNINNAVKIAMDIPLETIIIMNKSKNQTLLDMTNNNSLIIDINIENLQQAQELELIIVHCLCKLVNKNLFGSENI